MATRTSLLVAGVLLAEIDALERAGHFAPSAWERQFLASLHQRVLDQRRDPSPKQYPILERIHDAATQQEANYAQCD